MYEEDQSFGEEDLANDGEYQEEFGTIDDEEGEEEHEGPEEAELRQELVQRGTQINDDIAVLTSRLRDRSNLHPPPFPRELVTLWTSSRPDLSTSTRNGADIQDAPRRGGGGDEQRVNRVSALSAEIDQLRKELDTEKGANARIVAAEKMRAAAEMDDLKRQIEEFKSANTGKEKKGNDDTPASLSRTRSGSKRQRPESKEEKEETKQQEAIEAKQPAKNDSVCPICTCAFENNERGCVFPCGHAVYHFGCALDMYEKIGKCALHNPGKEIHEVKKVFI